MATLTVRNLPDSITRQLKKLAQEHDCSMEQEVRNILQEKLESRSALFSRITERSNQLPSASCKDIDDWLTDGRKRNRK
ncbi:MAG: FitA-like ribbon-helix-helix domain-containing protein [Planctomycetota bacterium]